jgi:hypothetical protein
MPRIKYEETVYEKTEYSGKIFMYCSPSWNVLYPVVDIIRILKKNTIIGFKYGKGQQMIRIYGTQYNHSVLGYDLKNKNDYLTNFKAVKNIFIFSDESDTIATNLMSTAKKNNINVICYSNLDNIYHFYKNVLKQEFKKPSDLVDHMYDLADLEGVKKIADLFPEFEILDPPHETKNTTLDESIEIYKQSEEKIQKEKKFVKLYDPHLSRLKQMEYERSMKNVDYNDTPPVKETKTLLSRFFNKKN